MTRTQAPGKSRRMVAWMALWLALVVAVPVGSNEAGEPAESAGARQDTAESADRDASEPSFPVPPTRRTPTHPEGNGPSLDALLHLPSNFISQEPRAVAGAGESVWRGRFEKANREFSEAQTALEETQRELEGVAQSVGSSQWSIAAPGGESGASPTTSPLSFRLRQRLRGDRELVDATQKAKRELQIEADLAGVPQRWRTSPTTSDQPAPN
jgi:hypothetical protein